MVLKPEEETVMMRYLLGDLPTAEQTALEARYFADDDLFLQLQALEDELIRDYLRGALQAGDLSRFQSKYLASPPLVEKVERMRQFQFELGVAAPTAESSYEPNPLFRTLDAAQEETRIPLESAALVDRGSSLNLPEISVAPPVMGVESAWMRISTWLTPRLPSLGWVSAACVVAVGAWLVSVNSGLRSEIGRLQEEKVALERSYAVLRSTVPFEPKSDENPTITPPRPPIGVLSFFLVPGLTRDGTASSRVLILPDGVQTVKLQIALPAGASYQRFRGAVRTAEGETFGSFDAQRSRSAAGAPLLVFEIQSSQLKRADYILKLEGTSGGDVWEEIESYVFTVSK